MRLFVDVSGSAAFGGFCNQSLISEFLTQLSACANGYFVLFNDEIVKTGLISDLMEEKEVFGVGGGTDPNCLSIHLDSVELKVMVTDGLLSLVGQVSNLLMVDPTTIEDTKRLALHLALLDGCFDRT